MRSLPSYLLLLVFININLLAFGNSSGSTNSIYFNSIPGEVSLVPIQLYAEISDKAVLDCNNTTFYMRLASAGNKIVLHQAQGLLDGSFIAVGELISPSGSKESFMVRLDNNGDILSQDIIRINNTAVSIQGVKINLRGAITIVGIVQGSNSVFVAQMSDLLSTNWVETIDMGSAPTKLTLHLLEQEKYALAVHTPSSVVCFQLNSDGSISWSKEVVSTGVVTLVGFANMVFGGNGLVTLNFRNGRYESEVTSISSTGNIVSTHILGDGIEEHKPLGITSFFLRMTLVSIKKNSAAAFNIVRNRLYQSSVVETKHEYQVAGTYDFNTSGAIANAGDAMGLCSPQNGKLLFIKQFSDYNSSVEFGKQYNVPLGSTISALTKAYDGGYLFGLNAGDSSQILLLKTDSTGILAGCGYQDLPVTSVETPNVPNTVSPAVYNTGAFSATPGTISLSASSLSNTFNCRENYCPPAPVADTCQATYFKTLVSNSYAHSLGGKSLMRGNKSLYIFSRLDNVLGDVKQRLGLKLYDEGGEYIKGVYMEQLVGANSSYSRLKQISDSTVLYCTVSFVDADIMLTFRVFSDNLDLIWQHSFRAPPEFNLYSGGFVIGDIHKDREGNFYLCGTRDGALGIDPKIMVCKISPAGAPLWVKRHSILGGGYLQDICMTSTAGSLIFVLEGGSAGSVSVRMDKTTGQMLNAFKYQNSGGGILYTRLLEYEQGRVLYGGQNGSSHFVMGSFDSTARPNKLKYVAESSSFRSGDVKNGRIYASLTNRAYIADILFAADTALNVVFANRYNNFNFSSNLVVNDAGNIYTVGNYQHGQGNRYYDPFIRKYDADGRLGSCVATPFIPTIVDINLNTVVLNFSDNNIGPLTVVPPLPINLYPDTYGHGISSIVCTTSPSCNLIDITGPASVCRLNVDYTFNYTRSPGCNQLPEYVIDPAMGQVTNLSDSTIVIRFLNTGSAWIKVLINSGCSQYADSIQVQIQTGGAFTLGEDTLICQNDTLVVDAGNGFNSYTWQDGSIGQTFNVTRDGEYHVTVTNTCGEILKDSIYVTLAAIPVLTIGNDTTVCKADTIPLIASPGFGIYNWSPTHIIMGNGRQVRISPLQDEEIKLHAITSDGCNAFDTLNVFVKESRLVNLGRDSSFCDRDSLELNAGAGYTNYVWSNGDNTNSTVVKQPGSYWVLATDVNGCFASDTLVVPNVYSLPIVNLGTDINLCLNESRILDPGNFTTYLWQDNSDGRYYTANSLGIHHVTVTNQHRCTGTDSIEVKNIFPLPVDFLIAPDSICSYEKIDLITGPGYHDYLWSDGSTKPVLTAAAPGLYTLTVVNSNGCKGRDTIQLFQKNCQLGVYIPNAFTPNGDGNNDIFKATVFGNINYFRIVVYNRYGELIFISNDPTNGWNGKYRGMDQNPGAYIWQCNYTLNGKLPVLEKGSVMLIR